MFVAVYTESVQGQFYWQTMMLGICLWMIRTQLKRIADAAERKADETKRMADEAKRKQSP